MEQIKDKEIEALEIEIDNKYKELNEIIEQKKNKYEEINNISKELCKQYERIFDKYMGKKVNVKSVRKSFLVDKHEEVVGFLEGFYFYDYSENNDKLPKIKLLKVKKNGQKSSCTYRSGITPSLKDVVSIQIIE